MRSTGAGAGGAGEPDARRDRAEGTRSGHPRPRARRPKWPIPLILLGLLGLALAAILGSTNRGRAELPENFNAVRPYSGTATTILNTAALQSGDFGAAFITDAPVTGQTTTRVLETSGDNARVLDERTLTAGGTQLGGSSNTYAVNRHSLEPASNPPSNWDVQPHQGLTVAFPPGTQRKDYQAWISDTQSTSPLHFVREETRGGVNTFVFQADVAPAPIRDPSVLASLPPSLTRAQLQGIASQLSVPDDERALLNQALPGLPAQVPLTYTTQGTETVWVEPTTGQIVDSQRSLVRNATVGGPGGATLAMMPIYNVETRFTDDAVAAASREAADRRNSLNTAGRVWPWILGVLGAIAVIAGLLGLLMRRRTEPVAQAPRPSYRPNEATTRRPAESPPRDENEARRREPQPPYTGTNPHTGPYRSAGAGAGPPESAASGSGSPESAGPGSGEPPHAHDPEHGGGHEHEGRQPPR